MSDIQTPEQGTEQEPVAPSTEAVETAAPSAQAPVETEAQPQEPDPATPQQPETPQAPDYKEKFVNSQRESILNAERVNVANSRIEQLTKQDTPTDEAMRTLYPEWDTFNDVTKQAFIKVEAQNMRSARIEAQQQDILDRQKLEDELDAVVETSEFAPKLKGKETEFKRFARNPKNRGIAAETLAKAFLFDVEEPSQPTPMTEALPVGSGGPREPLKPKKISLEEAAQIRKTNYKQYLELVKSGQIDEDI